MLLNRCTPKQSLNPAFLKQRPERAEIELFKKEFISLLDRINESESEEHHKNLLIDFLNSVYYKSKHYINTKDRTDLVIHNGVDAKTAVGVLIEVKKPTNKAEMISENNLNAKSFQELVLYYLRERKKGGNFELRYLIITNIYQWFVFDAQIFEKVFYENKELVRLFEQFDQHKLAGTSTDFFYKEIASPEIQKIQETIPYTYFDIRDYDKILRNEDKADDKKLIALYKFLSPTHLLKLPFTNDYNQLNKEFYAELLHIIGLEEVKQGTQKFIVRKKEGSRDYGSIIENAIEKIDSTDRLSNIPNVKQYGDSREEQLFTIAMNLSITWINRILFLKLLEAQIVKYHKGCKDYTFLSTDKIGSFDDMDGLFFQILARKTCDRKGELKNKFTHVPYLNSSLFEPTELEAQTVFISNLHDNATLDLYSRSILKCKKDGSSPNNPRPLEYLLHFLDAYDFSSEGAEDIQEENKPLISASVLGLIFEKINGYKDGSFFTPSFITMYMCGDTITRTVLQKFNEVKGWDCQTVIDLHNKINDIPEANHIFNSIRLCDPAVGSGHYLVSALNEMIALKSKLGILIDKEGKLLKQYRITIENDELIITDNESGIFQYTPHHHESQRVQETLFHEKQTIIEKCLFGVDINPNSVKICQLRLWIELLKHTYYIQGTNELETLPNIDINIKRGNSLISRFALDEDLKEPLKQIGYSVANYRNAINDYHNAHDKEKKRELKLLIDKIKSGLKTEVSKNDPLMNKLRKTRGELEKLGQGELFTSKKDKDNAKKATKLNKEIAAIEASIDEIRKNKIYEDALEWRIEFPEVLSDSGDFVGFDAIIGNPPYIQLQSMGAIADVYCKMEYKVYERTGDIYCLFYELANDILRPNGFLSFITSNKWMRAGYGEKMRRYFVEQTNPVQLIDFAGVKVFDEATVDVNIMSFQKAHNEHKTTTCLIKKDFNIGIDKLSDYLSQHGQQSVFGEAAVSSFAILSDIEQRIKEKIERVGTPLKNWDIQINYGIKTGFNEAFIIDGATKDRIIKKSPKSAEIIRPILRGRDIKRYGYEFADLWLICTFPSLKIDIEEYPAVKEHLLSFGYDRLKQTGEKGARKKTNNKWFETQDSISYWDDFSKQKIVYIEIMTDNPSEGYDFPSFSFDNKECVLLNTAYMMVGKIEELKYILSVLNSKLGKLLVKHYVIQLQNRQFRMLHQSVINFPIPLLSNNELQFYAQKVDKILANKTHGISTTEIEKELDKTIYQLYNLTKDEIGFIESLL